MSRAKMLVEVSENLRVLADSIHKVALALNEEVEETIQEVKTEFEEVKEEINEVVQEKVETPKITLEDVRAVLVDKSQNGFNKEVKELIKKYGATKLSGVDTSHYENLLNDARSIKDE